jgi:hypothetical protein
VSVVLPIRLFLVAGLVVDLPGTETIEINGYQAIASSGLSS